MVIDGHSLAFRAFFALPTESFTTTDGQHTNAIHGFISMLLTLLKDENPSHVAVAFDLSGGSFRTREYTEYKAGRDETPPEFLGQVELLQDALHAMGIQTLTKEDYEADDILATLARQGVEKGYRVLVVSGDRDAIQLVNDEVTLLYPSTQGVSKLKRYTPATVEERYGVKPENYPDVAALVGEKSDNLPGIPKVGEKTAAKWINQYGSLDEILAHADEIKGKVGESLREHQDNAVRNRKLNRLVDDVALETGPDDLERAPIDVDAVREVFTNLQFRTLQDRVLKLADADQAQESTNPADLVPIVDTRTGDELAAWLTKQRKATSEGLSLTLSATGEQLEIGVAGSEAMIIPDAAAEPAVAEWLGSDEPKRMFDAKPQLHALNKAGIAIEGRIVDGQIAAWLHHPQTPPKRLAELVRQTLDEALPEGDPNQLGGIDGADAYTASDAFFTGKAVDAAVQRLAEPTRRVFDEIETPLIPVLASMEQTGIAIDEPFLRGLSSDLADSIAQYEAEAFEAIGGERINLGSPKQLQTVLFETLKMPKTRRTKTGYSTDAESLAELERTAPHPFLGALRRHRDAVKLRQIMESLLKSIADDGRIHTTYVQTGSATGRLSSTDPNLQNIPIRSEEGRRIRRAFIHGPEFETLFTADYSQIEMRIMAHLSGDAGLIDAYQRGEDLHRFVGSQVFGVAPEDVTPDMRSKVKAMSYGLAYGLSPFGLSKQLQIETAEAKDLIAGYFARFGPVRDYLRGVVENAREQGYTETIFGRRRLFPELNAKNRVIRENAERAALNSPIQGSAADIMKIAMIGVQNRLAEGDLASRMLLQVHDELVIEVAKGEADEVERIVREEMGSAAELSVPLEVSVGSGANWDEAGH